MGMKANSGLFLGTRGAMKYKLDIQFFASKAFSKTGNVSISSLQKHGEDLLNKSPNQIKSMLNEVGYESKVQPSKKAGSTAKKVVTLNPSKERNITQVQISPDGSKHHGNVPYVKVSTKDIGIVKIIDGKRSDYKTDGNEKATLIFKGGK